MTAWRAIVIEKKHFLPDTAGSRRPPARMHRQDFRQGNVSPTLRSAAATRASAVRSLPSDRVQFSLRAQPREQIPGRFRLDHGWRQRPGDRGGRGSCIGNGVAGRVHPEAQAPRFLEQRVTLHSGGPARRAYHWWANAAVELDDPHTPDYLSGQVDAAARGRPYDALAGQRWRGSERRQRSTSAPSAYLATGRKTPGWPFISRNPQRSGALRRSGGSQRQEDLACADGDKYVKENLTENFSSYVEMQAGIVETQPEFLFLQPGEAKTFSHYWIPLRGASGGSSRANRDLLLNIGRSAGSAVVEISATHAITGAKSG